MKSLLQYRITGFKGAFWIIKSSCYLSVARCRTISSTRTLLLKRLLLYPDAKEGVEGHQHILELDNSISYNLLVISYLGLLVGISYPFSRAKTPGSATSLPVVGPCRSSAKEGRVPNHGSHKEQIFTEHFRPVSGKKRDVLISREGKKCFLSPQQQWGTLNSNNLSNAHVSVAEDLQQEYWKEGLRSFHWQWFVTYIERQGELQRTSKMLLLHSWLNKVNQGCPWKCPGHCSPRSAHRGRCWRLCLCSQHSKSAVMSEARQQLPTLSLHLKMGLRWPGYPKSN